MRRFLMPVCAARLMSRNDGRNLIELKNITKTFGGTRGKASVHAVEDVNLRIDDGEVFGIIGFSGAGKSTLVRCINLLERPTSGQVLIDGVDLMQLKVKELRDMRKKIGMIFQQFNLLEQSTVAKNVAYPLKISGVGKAEVDARVKELLQLVDLADKADAYPSQLSGGQKQRVAIARALATNPRIILCDEATSALDPITTRSILDLLARLNKQLGVTIVVITHEMRVVEQICDRVAVMAEGRIQEVGSVRDVFLQPKSDTARKLIEPEGEGGGIGAKFDVDTVRIAFTGDETGAPVISDMTLKCETMVNILAANAENISGKIFGQMQIELPKQPDERKKIEDYLQQRGLHYEIYYAEGSEGAKRVSVTEAGSATTEVEASLSVNCESGELEGGAR
jgi:D-methionine transport system ATP-binding protein